MENIVVQLSESDIKVLKKLATYHGYSSIADNLNNALKDYAEADASNIILESLEWMSMLKAKNEFGNYEVLYFKSEDKKFSEIPIVRNCRILGKECSLSILQGRKALLVSRGFKSVDACKDNKKGQFEKQT